MAGRRSTGRRLAGLLAAAMLVPLFGLVPMSASIPSAQAGSPAFPPLTLTVSADPSAGPIPLTVAFTAVAGGGATPYRFNWSFGDGTPNATTMNANHSYGWVAVFHVHATVVDAVGEIVTQSLTVTSDPAPLSVGLVAVPSALAALQTTYLETSVHGGTGPYQFAWIGLPIGCPTQSVQNLSCTPRYGGSYVINVTVTDSLGVSASSVVGLVVSGAGPPPTVQGGVNPPYYGNLILGALGVGAVVVIAAALVGRRARRRRSGPVA